MPHIFFNLTLGSGECSLSFPILLHPRLGDKQISSTSGCEKKNQTSIPRFELLAIRSVVITEFCIVTPFIMGKIGKFCRYCALIYGRVYKLPLYTVKHLCKIFP
jgi:hypothetical protein